MATKKNTIWGWMYSRAEEIMIFLSPISAVLAYKDFKGGSHIDEVAFAIDLMFLFATLIFSIRYVRRSKESLNYLRPIYENYIEQNKPTVSEVRLHHIVDVMKKNPQARTAKEIMPLCDQSLIGGISVKSFQNNFSEAKSLFKTLDSEESYKSSVPVRYWEKVMRWLRNSQS
ncbi:hypothetical protein ICN32_03840 [Polynucleobacter wuianus]|uniref:hypothetical protein n=1 Tax=Polynucleobacter wuianus TaxID=1743168 RepID=UPI001C0D11ED|nr:hypothetical protein [Polynucleobacter wuianus]MBU3609692.1 hypothetical protein [Polynucleobacter wuianus]